MFVLVAFIQVYFIGNAPMAHLDLRSSSNAGHEQPSQESAFAASDDIIATTSSSNSPEQQQPLTESTIAASDDTTTTSGGSSNAEQQLPLEESTTAASDDTTTTTTKTSSAEQPPSHESINASVDVTTMTISSSSSSMVKKQRPDGRLFFHLATVVNDPWEVFVSDAVAADHAWVSRDELPQYIKDERLLALAHKML